MLTTGIILLTGIITACYSPQLVDSYWVSWLPICLFTAYINPKLRLIGLFLSGFLWATVAMHWQLDHRLAVELNNKRVTVVGEVINIPRTSSISTKFLFKPISISEYGGKLPRKVKLYWHNAPDDLQPGQVWRLKLKLKQPHGFQNPGGFDYERWMFLKGIHATGYVVKSAKNVLLDTNRLSLNALRNSIKQHIEKSCQHCNYTGVIQALALGYRGSITQDTRRLLKQTGTAHLIAVSGLHIGIVSAVFYSIGLLLWNRLFSSGRLSRKEFSMLTAWIAALCYSLLSGFDLPAQRAMLMISVVFISVLLRLPFNLLNSIKTAVILVLIVSPLAVLSESFWLTFSALMIIAFGSFLLQHETSRLKQLVIIQLLFSILFIPVSIFIFGEVHRASLAANLFAVPLVSFVIVPVNFILLMFFWLPAGGLQALYGVVDSLLTVLIDYLNWLQDNGLQVIHVAEMAGWKLMLLFIFMILLFVPKGFIHRAIWLLVLPPLVFWHQRLQPSAALQMTVLDVGMGTSIVVQTPHHTLIYDFGPGNSQGYSLGEWVVQPFLQSKGSGPPDRIVISHADQDHSGGFYALQDDYKGIPVYTGTQQELADKFPALPHLQDCHQTDNWMWDGIKFEFLSTRPKLSESENNRSCVLKITLDESSILIAGDIESSQERRLVSGLAGELKSNVLVAPHHGSSTSSTLNFIKSVSAEHVIFTTGYVNRWKFPRSEVVQRFLTAGSTIYQTDKDGAVMINCSNDECDLQKYRQQNPRIWY